MKCNMAIKKKYFRTWKDILSILGHKAALLEIL